MISKDVRTEAATLMLALGHRRHIDEDEGVSVHEALRRGPANKATGHLAAYLFCAAGFDEQWSAELDHAQALEALEHACIPEDVIQNALGGRTEQVFELIERLGRVSDEDLLAIALADRARLSPAPEGLAKAAQAIADGATALAEHAIRTRSVAHSGEYRFAGHNFQYTHRVGFAAAAFGESARTEFLALFADPEGSA